MKIQESFGCVFLSETFLMQQTQKQTSAVITLMNGFWKEN